MGSSSCLLKSDSNSERERIALLLQNGSVINQPPSEMLELAARLESMGLIRAVRREYVRCVNYQDRDVPTRNRDCTGKVYIDERLDEGGDEYRCPECDRVLFPFRYRKQRFQDMRSGVIEDGILAYVLRELAPLQVAVKELARGAYRVDVGDLGVVVCVIDCCPDKFLAHDWARVQPTLYLGVNARRLRDRFLDEAWLVRAALADVVAGTVPMKELLATAMDSTRLATIPNVSVPVFSRGTPPIRNGVTPTPAKGRRFVVEVGPKVIKVDGVAVTAPQATSRYQLFRILWERFVQDLLEDRPAEDFRPMSIDALGDELENRSGGAIDDAANLRRNLNRFQEDIESAIKRQLGNPIGRNDIIQTCPKGDQGDRDFGYRINPYTVLITSR